MESEGVDTVSKREGKTRPAWTPRGGGDYTKGKRRGRVHRARAPPDGHGDGRRERPQAQRARAVRLRRVSAV